MSNADDGQGAQSSGGGCFAFLFGFFAGIVSTIVGMVLVVGLAGGLVYYFVTPTMVLEGLGVDTEYLQERFQEELFDELEGIDDLDQLLEELDTEAIVAILEQLIERMDDLEELEDLEEPDQQNSLNSSREADYRLIDLGYV